MSPPSAPRNVGTINWLGLWTLYQKEVRRFLKVTAQTVIGPLVMSLLFLAIFAVALGSRRNGGSGDVDGVAFTTFLAPGLIMMAITQNAFANASSSLLIAKTQGTIVDLLMAPLRPLELVLAFVFSAMTRGLLVAVVVAVAMTPFVSLSISHLGLLIFHALAAAALLSLLGILAGLWAERMDNLAAVTNFAIAPPDLPVRHVLQRHGFTHQPTRIADPEPVLSYDRWLSPWLHRSVPPSADDRHRRHADSQYSGLLALSPRRRPWLAH